MGDMNELMHPNEKAGPGRPNISRINMFCDYVKQCGLLDLGYNGPAYTWTNKRRMCLDGFQQNKVIAPLKISILILQLKT